MYKVFILLFTFHVFGCVTNNEASSESHSSEISVKELIENKSSYHGSEVRVQGYVDLVFGGCQILPLEIESPSNEPQYWVWIWVKNVGCPYDMKAKSGRAIVKGLYQQDDGGAYGIHNGSLYEAVILWDKK